MNPDELKAVWQSQTARRRITIDADVLLQQLRRTKSSLSSSIFWGELFLILGLLVMACFFAGGSVWAMRQNPEMPSRSFYGFFLFALVLVAVAGYKGCERVRYMKRRPSFSDPILSCAEETLDLVRHEIRLWSMGVLWWYLLPLALGSSLTILYGVWVVRSVGVREGLSSLTLESLVIAIIFPFAGLRFCRWCVRKYYEPRRRELEELLASLKNADNIVGPAALPSPGTSN